MLWESFVPIRNFILCLICGMWKILNNSLDFLTLREAVNSLFPFFEVHSFHSKNTICMMHMRKENIIVKSTVGVPFCKAEQTNK